MRYHGAYMRLLAYGPVIAHRSRESRGTLVSVPLTMQVIMHPVSSRTAWSDRHDCGETPYYRSRARSAMLKTQGRVVRLTGSMSLHRVSALLSVATRCSEA